MRYKNENKTVSLMCLNCYNVDKAIQYSMQFNLKIKKSENIDNQQLDDFICAFGCFPWEIKTQCKCCGKETQHAIIDNNIANIISEFNKRGYITKYCCEGHADCNWISDMYISFDALHGKNILELIDRNNKKADNSLKEEYESFFGHFYYEYMLHSDNNKCPDLILDRKTYEDAEERKNYDTDGYKVSDIVIRLDMDTISALNFAEKGYIIYLCDFLIKFFDFPESIYPAWYDKDKETD